MDEGQPVLTKSRIYIWALLLLITPSALFATITPDMPAPAVVALLGLSTVIVLVMLIGTGLMFRYLTKERDAANFLLSVNAAIALYHVTTIVGIIAERRFGIAEEVFSFIQPMLLLIACIVALRYFRLHLQISMFTLKLKSIVWSVLLAVLFGGLFWIIKEPTVELFSNRMFVFALYTFFVGVAEELLFRFIIFKQAEKALGYRSALYVQALIFAAIHFIYFNFIIDYYSTVGTILSETPIVSIVIYFAALVGFGIVCGKLTGQRISEKEWIGGNVVYAMIVHWLTNLVALVLVTSI